MSNFFNVASELEGISFEMETVCDLIHIVITEVFAGVGANEDNNGFGRLLPYEQSFSSVLISALGILKSQSEKIVNISNEFYELNRKEVK